MANDLTPYLNVLTAEDIKRLTGPSQAVGEKLYNVYEGEVIRPTTSSKFPVSPVMALLEGLLYSSEVGAMSDVVARQSSAGKIKRPERSSISESIKSSETPSLNKEEDINKIRLMMQQLQPESSFTPSIEVTGEPPPYPFPSEGTSLEDWRKKKPTVFTELSPNEAAAFRVNQGAKLRGSNTQATLDENGRVVITGSGSPSSSKVSSSEGTLDLGGLMANVSAIKSPEERIKAATTMAGKVSEHEAFLTKNSIANAETRFGIPQLEQLLAQEEGLDKADPNYKAAGMVDSPRTTQVRNQLEQARLNAHKMAADDLRTNPELARIKTEASMFLNTTISDAVKMQQRKEIETEKDYEKSLMLSNAAEKATRFLYPAETAGMSKANVFDFLRANPDKHTKELIQNVDSPETLLAFSLQGNEKARKFLINEQAAGTPEGLVKAETDLKEFEKLAGNWEDGIKEAYSGAPTKQKAMKDEITAINASLMTLSPSEASKKQKELGFKYALEAMTMKKEREFQALSNWDASEKAVFEASPVMKDLLKRVANKKGGNLANVTLDDLLVDIAFMTPQDAMKAKELLIESAGREADRRGKGVLWKPSSREDVMRKINFLSIAKISQPNIDPDTLLAVLGDFFSGVGEYGRGGVALGATIIGLAPATLKAISETPFSKYSETPGNIIREAAAFGSRVAGTGKFVAPPETFAR